MSHQYDEEKKKNNTTKDKKLLRQSHHSPSTMRYPRKGNEERKQEARGVDDDRGRSLNSITRHHSCHQPTQLLLLVGQQPPATLFNMSTSIIEDNVELESELELEPEQVFCWFAAVLSLVILLTKLLQDAPRLHAYSSEAALTLLVGLVAGAIVHVWVLQEEQQQQPQKPQSKAIPAPWHPISWPLIPICSLTTTTDIASFRLCPAARLALSTHYPPCLLRWCRYYAFGHFRRHYALFLDLVACGNARASNLYGMANLW